MSEFKEKTRNKSYNLCVDHKTFLNPTPTPKIVHFGQKAQKIQPVT